MAPAELAAFRASADVLELSLSAWLRLAGHRLAALGVPVSPMTTALEAAVGERIAIAADAFGWGAGKLLWVRDGLAVIDLETGSRETSGPTFIRVDAIMSVRVAEKGPPKPALQSPENTEPE